MASVGGTGDQSSEQARFSASLRELVQRLPRDSALAVLLRDALGRPHAPIDPALARLASRLLLVAGPAHSAQRPLVRPLVRPAVFAACEEAFIEGRVLRIEYVSAAGEETRRLVEPHGLLLNATTWCVVAFDRERAAGRTFRLDRMRRAEPTSTPFQPQDARRLFEASRGS